jgi:hypothetical protein
LLLKRQGAVPRIGEQPERPPLVGTERRFRWLTVIASRRLSRGGISNVSSKSPSVSMTYVNHMPPAPLHDAA